MSASSTPVAAMPRKGLSASHGGLLIFAVLITVLDFLPVPEFWVTLAKLTSACMRWWRWAWCC